MDQLSRNKEQQELQVAVNFVDAYNRLQLGPSITDVQPLKQNGHDAIASMDGLPLQIQVTELVQRAYTFKMTQEEYDCGKFKKAVQLGYGDRPHRIDIALRDEALWRVIENKLNKSYSIPARGALLLLVFTTDALYHTEYVNAGVPTVSAALQHARNMLAALGRGPFSYVWFTNLQTRPVRVWPVAQRTGAPQ
jgi:hypothetical protein